MTTENLKSIARKLVAPGKGILAADESSGTIEKRLKSIGVPSTEENRRAYRELLFTTAGAGEFISGVILFDETIRQKTRDGRTFVKALEEQSIIPGIKVDKGAKAMANFPGEKVTEGLDGLRERLAEYRQLGARFAKWRAVIAIGDGIPTRTCIEINAESLALTRRCVRKPIWCQSSSRRCSWMARTRSNGISQSPSKHWEAFSRSVRPPRCARRDTVETEHGAFGKRLSGTSFGAGSRGSYFRCLKRVVPAAVPGIVFLSGGQTDQQATEHLNAMNHLGGTCRGS